MLDYNSLSLESLCSPPRSAMNPTVVESKSNSGVGEIRNYQTILERSTKSWYFLRVKTFVCENKHTYHSDQIVAYIEKTQAEINQNLVTKFKPKKLKQKDRREGIFFMIKISTYMCFLFIFDHKQNKINYNVTDLLSDVWQVYNRTHFIYLCVCVAKKNLILWQKAYDTTPTYDDISYILA